MFISQVIFEDGGSDDEKLLEIMKKKVAAARDAQGCISAECWKKQEGETAGYCLVNRWESKADFQAWMRASHAPKRQAQDVQGGRGETKPGFRKTAYQFETVEI